MKELDVIIKRKFGVHLRPATDFVRLVSKFKSSIKIMKNDEIADGKSVLDIMILVLEQGDRIKVIVDGEDEDEAVSAIQNFFLTGDKQE